MIPPTREPAVYAPSDHTIYVLQSTHVFTMQMHTESVRKMSPLIKFLAIIFSCILVYSAISMFFTQPVIKVISVPVPKSEKVSFEFGVDNKIDAISISFLITEKVPDACASPLGWTTFIKRLV